MLCSFCCPVGTLPTVVVIMPTVIIENILLLNWIYIQFKVFTLAKGQRPYPICHAKHRNYVFVQPTHPLLKMSGVTIYIFIFFCCKTWHRYHRKKNNCQRPIYYNQNRNITIKITKFFTSFHKWHYKLAPLIVMMEPLNSGCACSRYTIQRFTI